MIEKIDSTFLNKKRKINELIQSILNIKRQEANENKNETLEIKLGRRLEQRSYDKLSKEILEHIITRYEIDNKVLPTREELIKLMINFLGNIQKTPDYYNLKNGKEDKYLRILNCRVGKGVNGKIYSIKPDELITKKLKKTLAFKLAKIGKPYNIDIHISSAALLAYYDFQPKYYNKFFMEIGKYEKKNKERIFINVKKDLNIDKQLIIKNIRWYILYNFTNIKDQVQNLMIRIINEEFIKIDIGTFNSEYKDYNISYILNLIYNNLPIFQKYKKIVINELNKILTINEEFLLDLIIFRTRRGCFNNIDKEDLAIHFDCISSSYKVIKLNFLDKFPETFKKYKHFSNNKHFLYNLALSWMLYDFTLSKLLTPSEYNHYIKKFNQKACKFENIAVKIRNEEIPIIKLIENLIDIDVKVSYNKNKNAKDNIIEIDIQKEEENKEKNKYEIEKNKDDSNNLVESNQNNLQINFQQNNNSSIGNNEDDNDEILRLKVIDLKINDNDKMKMNAKSIKNNLISEEVRNQVKIGQKKEQKKSCWFCCGKDSVDVED